MRTIWRRRKFEMTNFPREIRPEMNIGQTENCLGTVEQREREGGERNNPVGRDRWAGKGREWFVNMQAPRGRAYYIRRAAGVPTWSGTWKRTLEAKPSRSNGQDSKDPWLPKTRKIFEWTAANLSVATALNFPLYTHVQKYTTPVTESLGKKYIYLWFLNLFFCQPFWKKYLTNTLGLGQ